MMCFGRKFIDDRGFELKRKEVLVKKDKKVLVFPFIMGGLE